MQPKKLTLKAPAKINLYLNVTGQRPDGYHTLETLMQKVSLYDELELRPGDPGVRLCCPDGTLPEGQDNLVHRAASLLLEKVGQRRAGPLPGVDITLRKNIPVAAGLGGGSSDAASTLKGVDALFDYGCTGEELAAIGIQLGADVPFFLADTSTALATGIGEILQPVAPLTGYRVLLVNPGFPVSTQWVYQTFALTKKEKESKIQNFQNKIDIAASLSRSVQDKVPAASLQNDLETVTMCKYPEIEQVKNRLIEHGAAVALMSGSGPTVYGLFVDEECAINCRAFFKECFEHVYLVSFLA